MDLTRPLILLISRVLACVYAIAFIAWYGLANGLRDLSGHPLGGDFINVYAAGVMVLRGQAAAVYQWPLHGTVEREVLGYAAPYYGWHYPPLFMGVAALAALLPYMWGFALYMAAGLAAYGAALRRLVPEGREYLWALAAFPGAFDNLINGQNGFITAALFGVGMLVLESNPLLAGCAFGLMSYKPQFFVVIPLALAAGGYGRALLACIVTAVVCAGLSWIFLGTEVWQAFFASLSLTQHVILEQGVTGWQKIQSVFSWTRMWGANVAVAYLCQGVAAAAAVIGACFVWHRTKGSVAAKAARCGALCAAMLLATPYLLDYDLVILAVPLAMLARQGEESGFLPYEKWLLAALWFLPMLARSAGVHGIMLTPPLLTLLLVFSMQRKAKFLDLR